VGTGVGADAGAGRAPSAWSEALAGGCFPQAASAQMPASRRAVGSPVVRMNPPSGVSSDLVELREILFGMPERPKLYGTSPLFVVSDLARAIDFYGRLGFRCPGTWGDPPCFAMVHRDGLELMLSLAENAWHVRPNGPNGIWDVYLRVTDVAAEKAALDEAGVTLVRQPEDTEYGMRELEVLDPDGYRVCLAENTEQKR
jgi:catechol 2,3-dioxygenase-like lactoylglutathione lyase family enzyme